MPPLKRRMSASCCKSRQTSYKFMKEDSTNKRQSHKKHSSKGDDKDQDDSCEESEFVENNKYQSTPILEKTFPGMIWDVGFVGQDSVFVCHGEGVDICDANLERMVHIEMNLPGGALGLSNGNLIAIDRNSDSVKMYTPAGSLIRSFSAGSSPLAVTVDCEEQQIFVTDIRDKCVHKYSLSSGHLEGTIGNSSNENFKFQWPLYITSNENDEIIVSDTIKKQLVSFNSNGDFLASTCLQTSDDSRRMVQPHGLAFMKNVGLMVVDTSVDSVELFDTSGQVHIQTLINYVRDGYKPKVVGANCDGRFVVGGSGGLVKLYSLNSNDLYRPYQKSKNEQKVQRERSLKEKLKTDKEFDTNWEKCKVKTARKRPRSNNRLVHVGNNSTNVETVELSKMENVLEVDTSSVVTVANNLIKSQPDEPSIYKNDIEAEFKFRNDDCIVIDDDDNDDEGDFDEGNVNKSEHNACEESSSSSSRCIDPAYHKHFSETDCNNSEIGDGIVISNVSSIKEVYNASDHIHDDNVIMLD